MPWAGLPIPQSSALQEATTSGSAAGLPKQEPGSQELGSWSSPAGHGAEDESV